MSQVLSSSQGTIEERFAHLLQPIRDLAKNWDVDIANFLEEYLDDLEKIEITFDDGVTTMNFSEAALLIQGSAGVYAKKVEYLHSLVFQVLDLVTQKKKQKDTSGGKESNVGDNDGLYDSEEQFLALDDITEGEGSYIKEQDVTSNKSVRCVPEMPTRLIPLEEAEKGDSVLYNKKGEIMGNHCDFNIDTGYICTDGSILLEMCDKALLDIAVRQKQTLAEENVMIGNHGDSIILPACAEDDDVELAPLDDFCAGDVGNNAKEGEVAATETVSTAPGVENVPRRSERKKVAFVRPFHITKPTIDPWMLLDAFEKSKAVDKPLKKKKPFKFPPDLEENGTKKRKKRANVKKELPPIHEVVEKLFSHNMKLFKNPLKIPEFCELQDAYWEECKLREKIKKEEIKMLKKEEREELMAEAERDGDRGEEEVTQEGVNADDEEDDDDIPQLQLDANLFAEYNPGHSLCNTNSTNSTSVSDDIILSYEDLVRRHVEKFLASASEYAQITELSRRVAEWEEKIKPKLEEGEGHEPFDIHKYGTYVIDQLVRGERQAFKELVMGKLEFEICRYALATLQLANVYNVELTIIPDKDGNVMDCLYVTLLSTKRHFEDLEEYQAPSLKTT